MDIIPKNVEDGRMSPSVLEISSLVTNEKEKFVVVDICSEIDPVDAKKPVELISKVSEENNNIKPDEVDAARARKRKYRQRKKQRDRVRKMKRYMESLLDPVVSLCENLGRGGVQPVKEEDSWRGVRERNHRPSEPDHKDHQAVGRSRWPPHCSSAKAEGKERQPIVRHNNNALGVIKQETSNPGSNPTELFTTEIPIHDYPAHIRELFSSDITQHEMSSETGCYVELRGSGARKDIRDRFHRSPPLHLFVRSLKRDNVEHAFTFFKRRLQLAKNMPKYQEKLFVGLDDVTPGCDILTIIGGNNGSNFKYISKETGVKINFRGRGSGYIEPQTGRESSEPLHLFIEHDISQNGLKEACSLAQDLIETVRDDYYKLNKQPRSSSRGEFQSFNRTSQMSRVGCQTLSRGDDQIGGRHRDEREYDNKGSGRRDDNNFSRRGNSSREERNRSRDGKQTDVRDRRQSRSPFGFYKSPNREPESKCSDDVYHHSKSPRRKERREWFERDEWKWKREKNDWLDKDKNSCPEEDSLLMRVRSTAQNRKPWNSGGQSCWDRLENRDQMGDMSPNEREGRNTHRDVDEWKNSRDEGPEKYLHRKEENRYYDSQLNIKQEECKSQGKKSRSQNQDNASTSFQGVALGQMTMIEDSPEKVRALKASLDMTALSQMNLLTKSTSLLDGVNPLKLTQEELQNLNHRQLLEVSKQQQALLMNLTAGVTSLTPSCLNYSPSGSEVLPNLHFNPYLNIPVGTQPPQPPVIYPVRNHGKPAVYPDSQDKDKPKHSFMASDRDRSPLNDRSETSQTLYGSNEKRDIKSESRWSSNRSEARNSLDRWSCHQNYEQMGSRSLSNRYGDIFENSAERGNYTHGSCSRERYSPQLHRDSERYSPQLSDGQERYSPQLENDFRTSPNKFSRNNSGQNWSGERHSPSVSPQVKDDDAFKNLRKLLKYRVAVIDRHYKKMKPQDESEIRSLVDEAQSTVPAWKHHKIEFVGMTSKDYVFVLMPYSLEGMKWLLDKTYLSTASGEKRFILFPYDDISNKVRLRSKIYFDSLDDDLPTEHEVLVELGKLNEGINTEMWKVLKYNLEGKGFFMMVAVDLLSYFTLRKMSWRPRYRSSYIKLEPLLSENNIDPRFI